MINLTRTNTTMYGIHNKMWIRISIDTETAYTEQKKKIQNLCVFLIKYD